MPRAPHALPKPISGGPDTGSGRAFLLPRLVGLTKALELLWSGDFISAEEANVSVCSPRCLDYISLWTKLILPRAPRQWSKYRDPFDQASGLSVLAHGFPDGLRVVHSPYGRGSQTQDHREAVAAFKAKRQPQFKGD